MMCCRILLALAACAPGSGHAPAGPPRAVPEYAFDVAAEAGVPARCLAHVMALPLLTRNGDPAVAAIIDGVGGAAFLAPSESVLGVYDVPGLSPPVLYRVPVQNISGANQVDVVRIDRLALAQGEARRITGFALGPPLALRVAGRAPVGVIGYDVLGNYDLLLDMPRQRAMLFRPSGAPDCPALSRWIAGAHAAPLVFDANGGQAAVRVRLDGRDAAMILEPAADGSVVGRDAAPAAGIRAGGGNDDRVRTQATRVMVGTRHRFGTVEVGDWSGRDFEADLEPAAYGVLGLPFFRHRAVLMAFPEHRVFFGDPHPDALPPDRTRPEPGPIATRVAVTSATEAVGARAAEPVGTGGR